MQHLRVNLDAYPIGMDVYETRRLRLIELLREHTAADLSRRSGIAPTTISRYKSDPTTSGHKRMTEDNARRLEVAGRKPIYWLDRQHWPQDQHTSTGVGAPLLAHEMSHLSYTVAPTTISWEQLVRVELPKEFFTIAVDNSMAPEVTKGTRFMCITGQNAEPGDWVLCTDSRGSVYLREYKQVHAGQWEAHASNSAYLPMNSARDNLTVVAIYNGALRRKSVR